MIVVSFFNALNENRERKYTILYSHVLLSQKIKNKLEKENQKVVERKKSRKTNFEHT